MTDFTVKLAGQNRKELNGFQVNNGFIIGMMLSVRVLSNL